MVMLRAIALQFPFLKRLLGICRRRACSSNVFCQLFESLKAFTLSELPLEKLILAFSLFLENSSLLQVQRILFSSLSSLLSINAAAVARSIGLYMLVEGSHIMHAKMQPVIDISLNVRKSMTFTMFQILQISLLNFKCWGGLCTELTY